MMAKNTGQGLQPRPVRERGYSNPLTAMWTRPNTSIAGFAGQRRPRPPSRWERLWAWLNVDVGS